MCHSRDQLKFRVEELSVLHDLVTWIGSRMDQGYDLHWDLRDQYHVWVCIPGDQRSLDSFLVEWGTIVSAC
jgi:hypothetical protein